MCKISIILQEIESQFQAPQILFTTSLSLTTEANTLLVRLLLLLLPLLRRPRIADPRRHVWFFGLRRSETINAVECLAFQTSLR
jgi:hypothetical protein